MTQYKREFEALENKSLNAIRLLEKGVEWFSNKKEKLGSASKINLIEEEIRKIKKVKNASQKRPSIAIYGQSQVGKSFLVRTLANSSKGGQLQILNNYNGEGIDFLKEINPPGGRESTGIITRFTTENKSESASGKNSFRLELLSQMDVAAIIMNAYLGNVREYESSINRDDFISTVSALKSDLSSPKEGATKDEIFELINYIRKVYRDNTFVREAEAVNYFSDLVEILPFMDYDQRWKALELLWGKNEFLTELFNNLSNTLADLKFNKVVYTNTEAIVNDPSQATSEFSDSSNILDVARVKEIYKDKQLQKVIIEYKEGGEIRVPRGNICALIKELELRLVSDFDENDKRNFLNQTDLLDFPGSKNQETTPEVIFNSNPSEEKLSAFVRGKVSYLFHLYTKDYGISTLLYCMHQEPPEVPDAPKILAEFVQTQVGRDPFERKSHEEEVLSDLHSKGLFLDSKHVSPLLIAMTKFNVELTGKGDAERIGKPNTHDAKWFARFQENFCTYMQKPVQDKWIENWTSDKESFKFLFPLRDPGFSKSIFDGYSKESPETGIREDVKELIEDMGKSFNKSETVNKFIFDKRFLWNDLVTPNKTGFEYLCKYLAPSSHPVNLLTQLNGILEKSMKESLSVLSSEYKSGDFDTDLKIAKMKGAKAFTALSKMKRSKNAASSRYFEAFALKETEVWRLLYDFQLDMIPLELKEEGETENTEAHFAFQDLLDSIGYEEDYMEQPEKVRNILKEFFGLDDEGLNEFVVEQIGEELSKLLKQPIKENSRADDFIEILIDYWLNKLLRVEHELGESAGFLPSNREAIQALIEEFKNPSILNFVHKKLAEVIEPKLRGEITNIQLNVMASCSATILNNYFYSATWMFEPFENRPKNPKSNQLIFETFKELPTKENLLELNLKESKRDYFTDYSMGVKSIFESNIRKLYGLDNNMLDNEENKLLGEIIDKLNLV